jgi:hypothetical protein
MKARFIQEMGTRGYLRIYWDRELLTKSEPDPQYPGYFIRNYKSEQSCPNCCGGGKPGYHNALTLIRDVPELNAGKVFGEVADYPPEKWPTQCSDCGALVPMSESKSTIVGQSATVVHRQVFTKRLYNTASGSPEPGDLYESHWHESGKCIYWDNCSGQHLQAVLPNGDHWDLNSRASNCTMRQDRTHRCWIVSGDPRDGTVHVDKNGVTCAAGAGSIAVEGYHGFLHHGHFTSC